MRGLAALALISVLASACGNDDTRTVARLLFVAEPDGYVFTIGADGRGLRQLTRSDDWGGESGSWSPDSSQIAVVTWKVPETKQAALVVMSPDGKRRRRLAYLPSQYTTLRWISTEQIEARSYVAYRRVEVSRIDVEGGGRRVVHVERGSPGVPSPDGKQLAFERKNSHGDTQIFVSRPDRSQAVNVSRSRSAGPSPLTESSAAWSPDGSMLAFTLDRGLGADTREIRVMQADGSLERTVAAAPHWKTGPVWSADGRFLAYVADADDDGLDELYVAPLAGGPPRRLVERDYIRNVAWEPLGEPKTAAPTPAQSPVKTRRVQTYRRELAPGNARLDDVRLLLSFASDEDRPELVDLSPDGSLVALFRRGSLEVLDLRTNRVRFVAPARGTGAERQARFSPDGNRLLYRRWAKLMLLDLRTGRTSRVATAGWGSFAWLADGRIAFDDRGRLQIVRPGQAASKIEGAPRVHRWALSSSGRRLLYDRRCETFLLDRISGETRRLSGHMFVLPRSWAPGGTHFVLQWAEECNRKTGAIWAYHTYDVLYNRAGDRIAGAGAGGHGATWSADSSMLFTYSQPTGTAVGGLEAIIAVDLPRGRASRLLAEGNAYSEAFLGPGRWVVFARYDTPSRVSYNETSGGLYVGRIVSD
jgi:Tol biopolymer transport system component